MLKKFKIGIIFALISILTFSHVAYAGAWLHDDIGWWYLNDDGSHPTNSWQQIDNKWYFFDENGYILTDCWKDEYYLGSDGAMVTDTPTTNESQEVKVLESALVKPVDIVGGGYEINSVGGISPFISVRNNSGKTIKYLHFEVTPFNAVNDPIYCVISGISTKTLTYTGPFDPDEGVCMFYHYSATWAEPVFNREEEPYISLISNGKKIKLTPEQCAKTFSKTPAWDCSWYNSTISYILLSKVTIEYMDGTSEVINNLNFHLPKYRY